MAIDNCPLTPEILFNDVLPNLYEELLSNKRYPVSEFAKLNNGVSSICRNLNIKQNISGLYAFFKDDKSHYVGISRNIVKRVRQHVTGNTHYDASLAYYMAKRASGMEGRRNQLMKNDIFMREFLIARGIILNMSVVFVEINDPITRYLFEVYAAMKLDTRDWNTFETH
jgi:hypothetical protein